MAFLNKLNDIAKNIGTKAGEAIEITKLNSKINSEKSAIDEVLKKIGDYYYQKYTLGELIPEDVSDLCSEIDAHNDTISEAKAEIERLKADNAASSSAPEPPEGAACSECGKINAAGTKFCQECGNKLEAPAPAPVSDEKRICVCGAEVAGGVKFCSECGTKFE